jgi:DNA-binding HxlR family transcriptional regulator
VRSYAQFCALAKALDVVGDRWTLLIVRELLARGSCRYTDLRDGLPGIATNLLAERLRHLEEAGIIRSTAGPAYELTDRGEELRAVVHALGRWGGVYMAEPADDDAFRSHWLSLPLEIYLTDGHPDRRPVRIAVRASSNGGGKDDEPMVVETVDGEVRARPGTVDAPDATIAGPPQPVLGALLGLIDLDEARRRGVTYDGDPKALRRLTRRN